jgi:hypothetical protein
MKCHCKEFRVSFQRKLFNFRPLRCLTGIFITIITKQRQPFNVVNSEIMGLKLFLVS